MTKNFVNYVPLVTYLLFFTSFCFAQQSAVVKTPLPNISSSVGKINIPVGLQSAKLGAELTRDLNDLNQKNSKEYSLYFRDFSDSNRLKVDVKLDAQVRTLKSDGYIQPEPYKIVQSLRNSGKLSEAKEKAQQYLKLNPKDVDVMLMLGLIYYQEKNYLLAEKYFHQVILISPRYLDAYLFLIKVKLANNDYPGARNVAKEGLKYFPANEELKKYQEIEPISWVKKTNLDGKAVINANSVLPLNSRSKNRVNLAPYKTIQLLRNAGKLNEGKEKAQKYLKLNPKDVDVMLMLGIIYYQEKNYLLAKKYFDQVILISPRYLDAYLFLIKVELANNHYPGARNVAKKGLKYFPSHQELKKYSKITSTSLETKTSFNFLSKSYLHPEKVAPLTYTQNLANVWMDQVDRYALQHRYYQVARVSKEALKWDPQNKKAIASLKEVNAISPKYAVGVNEIGALSQNDNVSDLNQTWNYSTLYYSRDTKYGQVIGSINYADRLGKNAAQGQVEVLPVFNENFTLDLAAAYANQPNLFPDYFLLAEGYFYLPKFVDFSLGARYADLGEPFYRVYTGSLSKDFSKYWLTFRPYHFVPKAGSSSTFYTFTLRRYFATTDCNLTLTIGYGRSPDLNNLQLVDFFVIDNRIVAINGEIPICNHRMAIVLGADYQRQIFPTGLIRNLCGGTVGFKWRF